MDQERNQMLLKDNFYLIVSQFFISSGGWFRNTVDFLILFDGLKSKKHLFCLSTDKKSNMNSIR
jgi:hypothetical protein